MFSQDIALRHFTVDQELHELSESDAVTDS